MKLAIAQMVLGARMRKGLWLAASLLVVLALLMAGCTGQLEGVKRPQKLIQSEKDAVIQIAVNTPQVSEWLKKESTYKTRLRWIVIRWVNSTDAEWWSLDYEQVVDNGVPFWVSSEAVLYPEVVIRFGEPAKGLVHVAVDLDLHKAVLAEGCHIKMWDSVPFHKGFPEPPAPEGGE